MAGSIKGRNHRDISRRMGRRTGAGGKGRGSVIKAETIEISGLKVHFYRKNIKNMYIRLQEDGSVVLSVPAGMPEKTAIDFFKSREQWIRKNQMRTGMEPGKPVRRYAPGEKYRLFGELYTIDIKPAGRYGCKIDRDRKEICISVPPQKTAIDTDKYMNQVSRKELRIVLEEAVEKWEGITGVRCSGWSVSSMTSRWGLCVTPAGTLRFSARLAQQPVDAIEYVVLHELAHITYPDHSRNFWNYVYSYMPEAPQIKKEMRMIIDYLPPSEQQIHNM